MLRQDTRLHFSSDLINLFLFSNSLPNWTPKQFFSVHLVREKTLKNVTCSYAFAQQTSFVIFSRQVNWSNGFHRYFLTVRDRSFAGLLISFLILKVYLIMFFYLIFAKVEWILSICIPSILLPSHRAWKKAGIISDVFFVADWGLESALLLTPLSSGKEISGRVRLFSDCGSSSPE